MKIGYLISVLSSINHAQHLMTYTANNYHEFQSEILPKWMAKLLFSACNVCIWSPCCHHDYKLWNTAKWQKPAFDKASVLRVIHIWSSCEMLHDWAQGKNNSQMYRSETAFRHKIFSWCMVRYCGSWNASFRIPIISTMRKDHSLNIMTGLYCVLNFGQN